MTVVDTIKSLGSRLLRREQPLPFPDTLSIESSYACNLKCVMCPRHFDESLQGMFPLELFRERVFPVLGRFRYVHLTGWGEPLMNKHLVEMLALCKQAGVWTCFTTNGLLLREPLSRRVIETGVDMINISCDASDAHTYEIVRGKGTFDVLMQRMEHMAALRREMNSPVRLEWTFVMMKNNIGELPGAVERAVRLGFERFNAKHMETAINREDLGNALWNTGFAPDLTPEWEEKLEDAIAKARRLAAGTATEFLLHPRHFAPEGQCLVRPANQVFIDYKGNVSSCCYLNKLDVRPYLRPEERVEDDGVMGELSLRDLVEILDSPRFVAFRRQWLGGTVPTACTNCVNLNRMSERA